MISSMTGFGAADGNVGDARASVEIRTVNHRFFSPNLKLPAAFARWEGEIRELLRQKLARGHVTLTARLDRPATSGSVIDEARLAVYTAALKELKKKHALGGEVDLATVLRLPDVVTTPSEEMDPRAGEALSAIVSKAIDNLITMRRTEGAQLAAFLLERVAAVESRLARIETRAPVRLKEQHERVKRTVSELMGGAGGDPQRIAQEVAITFPERVRSLTSIMSTTGNPKVPPPTRQATAMLMAPPPQTRDEYIARFAQNW